MAIGEDNNPASTRIVRVESKDGARDAFWAIGPLAVASSFFGLMPWPPFPPNKSFRHTWPTILTLVLIATLLATNILKGGTDEASEASRLRCTYDYLISWLYLMLLCASWFNALIIIWNWRAGEKAMLGLDHHRQASSDLNQEMRKVSWRIVAVSLADAASYFIYTILLGKNDVYFSLLIFSAIAIRDLAPGQLVHFSMAIQLRFEQVNRCLSSICCGMRDVLCTSNVGTPCTPAPIDVLSAAGQQYFSLCRLTEEVSRLYGHVACITYLSSVSETAVRIFLVIGYSDKFEPIVVGLCIGIVVSRVVIVYAGTCIIHNVREKSSTSLDDLIRAQSLDLSRDCQLKIQAIVQKMSGPPVQITAGSFFAINRELITSLAGAVTTYLIIQAQFRGSEGNHSNFLDDTYEGDIVGNESNVAQF